MTAKEAQCHPWLNMKTSKTTLNFNPPLASDVTDRLKSFKDQSVLKVCTGYFSCTVDFGYDEFVGISEYIRCIRMHEADFGTKCLFRLFVRSENSLYPRFVFIHKFWH